VVRAIWPGAGSDIFGDNESQEYLFTNLMFVSLTADRASVDCDRKRLLKPPSAKQTSLVTDNVRIELRKANGAWRVTTMSERSK
jgi:hypothetical protein